MRVGNPMGMGFPRESPENGNDMYFTCVNFPRMIVKRDISVAEIKSATES